MLKGHWVNSRGSQSNFLAVVGLSAKPKSSVGPKGELVVPFNGLNEQAAALGRDGAVLWRDQRWSRAPGGQGGRRQSRALQHRRLSPFMVFDRAPWYQDGAWLLPLLYASLGALRSRRCFGR
jgi:hypothetical protein